MTERFVPSALGTWLEAADPGAVRRERGAQATLAAVSTWLTLRLLIGAVAGHLMPQVSLFGVTACFVCALVVADPRRTDRAVTFLCSALVFAAVATLAALIAGLDLLVPAMLLVFVFLTFAVRRRGLRAGELALVATMGLYFAGANGVTTDDLPWFVAASAIGVAWLAAWQLVLLPYDPRRSIASAGRAFSRRSGDLVATCAGIVRRASDPAGLAALEPELRRRRRQVRLSREVIESQFPGVLAPRGWTHERVRKLNVTLYDAELGLGQIADACTQPAALAAIPADLGAALLRVLDTLSATLRDPAAAAAFAVLQQEAANLRDQVRMLAQGAIDRGVTVAATRPPEWVPAAIRMAGGLRQVAQSVGRARALLDAGAGEEPGPAGTAAPVNTQPGASTRPGTPTPPLRTIGRFRIHPTTGLGVQAVIAVAAAMLVGRLSGVDHANWVFWTAFVVIAGSVGESLRRMLLRVLGTVAGVAIGVGLAIVLPDNAEIVVLVATAALFLTIYVAPISYAMMVFWLNLGFVVVYAQLGANPVDLLVQRPFSTLLGALVAAVVVVTVLPSRLTGRYRGAVVGFLSAVGDAVGTWMQPGAPGPQAASAAAGVRVDGAWRQVERTLENMAFETNPIVGGRSPLTEQGTRLGALAAAVTRLGQSASATDEPTWNRGDALLVALAQRIRDGLRSLIGVLNGSGGTLDASLVDLLGPGESAAALASIAAGGPAGRAESGGADRAYAHHEPGILSSLLDVHARVIELARGLGATVEEAATTPASAEERS